MYRACVCNRTESESNANEMLRAFEWHLHIGNARIMSAFPRELDTKYTIERKNRDEIPSAAWDLASSLMQQHVKIVRSWVPAWCKQKYVYYFGMGMMSLLCALVMRILRIVERFLDDSIGVSVFFRELMRVFSSLSVDLCASRNSSLEIFRFNEL